MSIRMNKSKPNTLLSQFLAPLYGESSLKVSSSGFLVLAKLVAQTNRQKKVTLDTTMMHIGTIYVRRFPALQFHIS